MKKHLTIENSTHVLILLFTLTSWANIRAFLIDAGHDPLAAALLSGALGAALAVLSLALTKVDMQTERATFGALVSVGAGLALLSGALQSAEYATHLDGLWPYVLGYTVPLLGEIGLSLASALFSKAQSRSELRAVHSKMSSTVTRALDDALADFDTSQIRKRIDRSLNGIAARAVDGVTSELLAFYGQIQHVDSAPILDTKDHETEDTTHNVLTPDQLSQVRTDKKNQRLTQFLSLVEDGNLSTSEIADRLGVTTKTIGRYIDHFRDNGYNVSVNGVVKLA